MANVPIIGPKVQPKEVMEQQQRATPVDLSPIARGVQNIGGVLGQIGAETKVLEDERRLKQEKEDQFHRIRAAQDMTIAGGNALNAEWAEVAKLRGRDAEEQSVPRISAVFQDLLKQNEEVEDIRVQVAVRDNLMKIFNTNMERARKNASDGRLEGVSDTLVDELNLNSDTILNDPDDESNWQSIDKALNFAGGQLDWGKGVTGTKIREAKDAAAKRVIDGWIATGEFDRAESWLGKKENMHKVKDRADVVLSIGRARNAANTRQAHDASVKDSETLGIFQQDIKDNGVETALASSQGIADQILDPARKTAFLQSVNAMDANLKATHFDAAVETQTNILRSLGPDAPTTIEGMAAIGVTNKKVQSERIAELGDEAEKAHIKAREEADKQIVEARKEADKQIIKVREDVISELESIVEKRQEQEKKDYTASKDLNDKTRLLYRLNEGEIKGLNDPELQGASPSTKAWFAGILEGREVARVKHKKQIDIDARALDAANKVLERKDVKAPGDLLLIPDYHAAQKGASPYVAAFNKQRLDYMFETLKPDAPSYMNHSLRFFPTGNKDPKKRSNKMDYILGKLQVKRNNAILHFFDEHRDLSKDEENIMSGYIFEAYNRDMKAIIRDGGSPGVKETEEWFSAFDSLGVKFLEMDFMVELLGKPGLFLSGDLSDKTLLDKLAGRK